MKIVVDTSILIEHLRKGPSWRNFLSSVPQNAQLFVATIDLFELYSGKSSRVSRVRDEITQLVQYMQQIPLDEHIAIKAGELLRDSKQRIGIADYIIAASALEIGATVVTLNTKHFSQIPHLRLYQF